MKELKNVIQELKDYFGENLPEVEKTIDWLETIAVNNADKPKIEFDFSRYHTDNPEFNACIEKLLKFLPADMMFVPFELGQLVAVYYKTQRNKPKIQLGGTYLLDEKDVIVIAKVSVPEYPKCYFALSADVQKFTDKTAFIRQVHQYVLKENYAVPLNRNLMRFVCCHLESLKLVMNESFVVSGNLWGYDFVDDGSDIFSPSRVNPYCLQISQENLNCYCVGYLVDTYGRVLHTVYPQKIRTL